MRSIRTRSKISDQVIEVQVGGRTDNFEEAAAREFAVDRQSGLSTFEPVAAHGASLSTETRSWAAVVGS